MGSASRLLRLLSAPFPHLYRCSSALRFASLSPAAASVARRPRILSATSSFLPYPSANLHTRADPPSSPSADLSGGNVGDADQESSSFDSKVHWICPRCNSTNFTENTNCLNCNEVQPNTCGNSECPRCNSCLRCNCKCSGAHDTYCPREFRRLTRRLLGLENYEGGPELTLSQFKRKAKRLLFRCKLIAIREGDYFGLSGKELERFGGDGMSEEEKLDKLCEDMYKKLVQIHAIDLRRK